jgi:hypothetical protein
MQTMRRGMQRSLGDQKSFTLVRDTQALIGSVLQIAVDQGVGVLLQRSE